MSGRQDQIPCDLKARRSSQFISTLERHPAVEAPPMRIKTTHSGRYAERNFAIPKKRSTNSKSEQIR
jgi:hypothetical protein